MKREETRRSKQVWTAWSRPLLLAGAGVMGIALGLMPPDSALAQPSAAASAGAAARRPKKTIQLRKNAPQLVPFGTDTVQEMVQWERTHPAPPEKEIKPPKRNASRSGSRPTSGAASAAAPSSASSSRSSLASASAPCLPLPGTQPILTNFKGVQDTELSNDRFPPGSFVPDTNGAAGPSHLMEMVNGGVAIFTKSGAKLSQVREKTFFNIRGITDKPEARVFSPRVLFDQYSGRFIATAADIGASFVEGEPESEAPFHDTWLLIAISATSDPTGRWFKYAIDADALLGFIHPNGFFYYPSLGLSDDFITITGKVFSFGAGGGPGFEQFEKIWLIPKPQLLAGQRFLTWSETPDGVFSGGDVGNTPVAVHAFGPTGGRIEGGTFGEGTGVGYLVATTDDPQDSSGAGSSLRVTRILYDVFTTNFQFEPLSDVTVTPYSPPPPAPQNGGSELIDTDGNFAEEFSEDFLAISRVRLLNAVGRLSPLPTGPVVAAPERRRAYCAVEPERVNSIWCTHTVDVGGRAAIRWYQINVDSEPPALVQEGNISDLNRHFYYGTIAVNADGDAAFGFSGSAANEYVGAYAASRRANDFPGLTTTPFKYKTGKAFYNRSRAGGFDFDPEPWGRYSATCVDPVNDKTFWTIQEYAETPVAGAASRTRFGKWGTWWARFNAASAGLGPIP